MYNNDDYKILIEKVAALEKKENSKLSILISLISVLISIGMFLLAYFTFAIENDDKLLSHSPMLIVSSMKYAPGNNTFPDVYPEPQTLKFLLEDRCYIADGDEDNLKGPAISLIIDACESTSKKEQPLINFNTVTIENVGYDLMYFSLDRIEVSFKDGRDNITIEPSKQNYIYKRITYDKPIKILLSVFFNKDTGLFDLDKLKNLEYMQKKLKLTKGELLNARVPEMADLWKSITFYVTTINIHNESYTQTITLSIENDIYIAYSELFKE